jgi:prepilin-type N-terminal cleavage/methylation domain-containing protein
MLLSKEPEKRTFCLAGDLNMKKSTLRKSGFTLIELLVVLAIIAILAAILFPVFARARENARRASCQSNLKQIGLGIMQYSQDYDETLPPASACGSSTLETGQTTSYTPGCSSAPFCIYGITLFIPISKALRFLTAPANPILPSLTPGNISAL